jgi:hypothetical protein
MPTIQVQTETAIDRGWEYLVRVAWDDGRSSEHEVRLAWVDFEYWCGGVLAPSFVIEAVVRYLVEETPIESAVRQDLPLSFDAAMVRRWDRSADHSLRQLRRAG